MNRIILVKFLQLLADKIDVGNEKNEKIKYMLFEMTNDLMNEKSIANGIIEKYCDELSNFK